jgi:U3 small nucleolar RNA-associated protein 19
MLQVVSFVGMLDRDMTDRRKTSEVDVAPFFGASYASLAGQELGRRLKRVPTAFYAQPPKKLFDRNCESDFGGWTL